MEDLEKMEEQKDQRAVLEEIKNIDQYMKQLKMNPNYNNKIQRFINEIVNKYRNKGEVINYYSRQDGNDDINGNQYIILCNLRQMLKQYCLVKFGEDSWDKIGK